MLWSDMFWSGWQFKKEENSIGKIWERRDRWPIEKNQFGQMVKAPGYKAGN